MTKSLDLPDNVHLFSHRKPGTVTLDNLGVAIHGQSYATRDTTINLAAGYPAPVPGLFNVGLLHTCATGRPGHDPYAPCTMDDLLATQYAYWALGHIHTREVLHEDPWIVFSGNTQGRHIRETGAKGCTLVTIVDEEVHAIEHRALDVLRWHLCAVDCTGAQDGYAVLERIGETITPFCLASDRPLAVRIHLTGSCHAHHDLLGDITRWLNEVRALATDRSGGKAWVEEIRLDTVVPHDTASEGQDAVRELLTAIRAVAEDDEQVSALAVEFADLAQKLPYELTHGEDALQPTDLAVLRAAIAEAHTVLTTRLHPTGGIG
jgi:exonuclease SbcD